MGNRKKDKKAKRSREVEEASGDGEGKAAHQRPNCCDTFMLALVCFVLIVVIAAAIPIILAASGTMDIEYVTKRVAHVGPMN